MGSLRYLIPMVSGDVGRPTYLWLRDPATLIPYDLSASDTFVRAKVRDVGQTVLRDTIAAVKIPGVVNDDGSITSSPPYNVPGQYGLARIDWSAAALATAGRCEAEIEITFSTGVIITMFDPIQLTIREQF